MKILFVCALILLLTVIHGKQHYSRRFLKSSRSKEDSKDDTSLKQQSIFANKLPNLFTNAIKQSLYEQEVEDINAVHKFESHMVRRLIVMPLTDNFKPHQADAMHGKIQYGDKCSLPTSVGRLIYENRYEAPWIFEIKPVRNNTSVWANNKSEELPPADADRHNQTADAFVSKYFAPGKLSKAYVSPLDFRSPENYIFLPQWLMRDLDLKVNDQVDVSLLRMKLASLVIFQPLTLDWDELMEKVVDPKTLLEHEINKYSSLTAGSTIYINIHGKEYPICVKETIAEGGISVRGVRVQDADVRTDIDRGVLNALQKLQSRSPAAPPTPSPFE